MAAPTEAFLPSQSSEETSSLNQGLHSLLRWQYNEKELRCTPQRPRSNKRIGNPGLRIRLKFLWGRLPSQFPRAPRAELLARDSHRVQSHQQVSSTLHRRTSLAATGVREHRESPPPHSASEVDRDRSLRGAA